MGDAVFMVGVEIWSRKGKGVESLQLEAHFDRYLTKISEYLSFVHKSYLFLRTQDLPRHSILFSRLPCPSNQPMRRALKFSAKLLSTVYLLLLGCS